jgi:NAD(P)H-dependent FMN reductase
MTARILAFAGSIRRQSLNAQLLQVAVAGARDAGAEVTAIDLRDYPLPLYDGDLESEQGLPENAVALQEVFLAHDALLLACPEYNSSITPLMKNVLDWVSRPGGAGGGGPLVAFDGKVAGLVAASPGGLGGLRGLAHVRQILANMRVLVIPQQHALARARDAFDNDGALQDANAEAAVRGVGKALAQTADRLRG